MARALSVHVATVCSIQKAKFYNNTLHPTSPREFLLPVAVSPGSRSDVYFRAEHLSTPQSFDHFNSDSWTTACFRILTMNRCNKPKSNKGAAREQCDWKAGCWKMVIYFCAFLICQYIK